MIINKNSNIYRNAFYNVFKSMQLSGSYVLYYDLDWSKEELINFQSECTDINHEITGHTLHERDMEETIKKKTGFDCRKKNSEFPYAYKMKMCDLKYPQKQTPTVATAVNDACGVYFILAGYTLVTRHNYTYDQLIEWYEKLKSFCWLYVTGMKDSHVFKYFSQEVGLEITEDY